MVVGGLQRTLLIMFIAVLFTPIFSNAIVYEELHEAFTPTQADPVKRIDFSMESGRAFSQVIVDLDITAGPLYPEYEQGMHSIFWLHRGDRGGNWAGNIMGYVNVVQKGKVRVEHSIDTQNIRGETGQSLGFQQGKTSHVRYIYNTEDSTVTVIVDGNVKYAGTGTAPVVGSQPMNGGQAGFFIEMGNTEKPYYPHPNGPEVPTYGWKYQNLRVEFVEGEGGDIIPVETPNSVLEEGAGFEPNEDTREAITLQTIPGLFFTEPFGVNCPASAPDCEAEHWVDLSAENNAYEKIIVTFNFKTHDLLLPGRWQHLVGLRSACSQQELWHLAIKQAGQGRESITAISPRGNNQYLYGETDYEEYTTYQAEVTFDLRDEEAYVRIFDAEGNLLQTVGGRLNDNPENLATIEGMSEGFSLVFGLSREYNRQIYGQPHLWEFSDLTVKAVPLGDAPMGEPGSGDFSSDEGKLAILAANLLQTIDEEYRMECGPSGQVVTTPPSAPAPSAGTHYCVLSADESIAFGTFGTTGAGENVQTLVLRTYQDTAYASQVTEEEVNPTACDGINALEFRFQECPDAIANMHTYAAIDAISGASFIIVSQERISAFDPTLFDRIGSFFSDLFGGAQTSEEGMPLRRFHHGYFGETDGKQVAGVWGERKAILRFSEFTTDLNTLRPEDATYRLGSGGQYLFFTLDPQAPKDVNMWRTITAGLRVSPTAGTPISGGVCGDGVLDYGEQCDPAMEQRTCSDLYNGFFTEGTVGCFPASSERGCTFDVTACLSGATGGMCRDTYVQPEHPPWCPGDLACPSSGGGGGGGGGGGDDEEPPGTCTDPTGILLAGTQGGYNIYTRLSADGSPQIMVKPGSLPSGVDPVVCNEAGGRDVIARSTQWNTWFNHIPGTEQVVYYRIKHTGSGDWDTKIVVKSLEDRFVVTGTRQDDIVMSHKNCGGTPGCDKSGWYCWQCAVGDVFCENLNREFPISEIGTCADEADEPLPIRQGGGHPPNDPEGPIDRAP